MRYSVFEFSQEKLCEYNLNIQDAFILDWFAIFFTGGMEKRVFTENGIDKIYGWIKISKIMEDLPTLGISTEKGIRKRIDNLVEKIILNRITISSQNGKKSYYRATEIFESLINPYTKNDKTSQNDILQINNPKTEIKSTQNNSTIQKDLKIDNKKTLYADYQDMDNYELKETTIQHFPQRNSSTYAENINTKKSSQSPKTTYAKNNNTKKSPQRNSSTYAEDTFSTFPQRNSSTYALNNSLIKDYLVKDTVAVLTELTNTHFGKDYFDPMFYSKAAAFFSQNNIIQDNYEGYFIYIKNKISKKQIENPRGLAYKLFFQVDILKAYLDYKQQQELLENQKAKKDIENEQKKITCPCCSNKFIPNPYIQECEKCEFPVEKFSDEKEIFQYKQFLKLPLIMKNKYKEELYSFKNDMDMASKIRYLSTEEGKQQQLIYEINIKKKYGIIA